MDLCSRWELCFLFYPYYLGGYLGHHNEGGESQLSLLLGVQSWLGSYSLRLTRYSHSVTTGGYPPTPDTRLTIFLGAHRRFLGAQRRKTIRERRTLKDLKCPVLLFYKWENRSPEKILLGPTFLRNTKTVLNTSACPHALPQNSTPGTSQHQWEMENSASEGAAELVESVTEPRCACTLGENDTWIWLIIGKMSWQRFKMRIVGD